MHRIGGLDVERDDRVAALVIGGEELLLLGHDQRLALGAHHHLVLGVLELACVTMRLLRRAAIRAASLTRFMRSAPEKPGVPRAMVLRLTSGASGTLRTCTLRICSRPTTSGLGTIDLAVEAAGTQQRRIEHVGPVGGGDQDDALVRLEAVHLDQQLVERLLALVVAAAEAGAAVAADRVDLVDEDDAGRVLLGLLEHVAHARRADADEHLDEVGARNGEERHVGLARDRAREQRLAGAGRPDQQHAARNAAAEPLELAGIAQELDDLLEILLGLVDAGDVLEGDAAVRLGQQLGAALAEAERLAAGSLHLPRQEYPHADQRDERQPRDQERHEPRHVVLLRPRGDRHALAVEPLDQAGIVRRVGLEAAAVGEGAVNFRSLDHHVAHAALVDLVQQLGEGNVLARWCAGPDSGTG